MRISPSHQTSLQPSTFQNVNQGEQSQDTDFQSCVSETKLHKIMCDTCEILVSKTKYSYRTLHCSKRNKNIHINLLYKENASYEHYCYIKYYLV